MEQVKFTIFTATEAAKISNNIEQTVLSKGNVIDAIRKAAKEGRFSVTVLGLTKDISKDLHDNHGFGISGDKISWAKADIKVPMSTV